MTNRLPLSQCSLSHKGRIQFTISLQGCQNKSPVIKVLLRRDLVVLFIVIPAFRKKVINLSLFQQG